MLFLILALIKFPALAPFCRTWRQYRPRPTLSDQPESRTYRRPSFSNWESTPRVPVFFPQLQPILGFRLTP